MSAFTSAHGPQLVGRLGVGEGLLELGLPGRVGGEGVARRGESTAVQHDELLCDRPRRLAGARPAALPFAAVQPVERGVLSSRVRRDRVDLVRGHVEPVAAPVLEQGGSRVRCRRCRGAPCRRNGRRRGRGGRRSCRRRGRRRGPRRDGRGAGHAVRAVPTREVALGEHRDVRGLEHEAPVERRHDDVVPGGAARGVPLVAEGRLEEPVNRDTGFVKDIGDPGGAPGPLGGDDDDSGAGELADAAGEWRHIAQRLGPTPDHDRLGARPLGGREQRGETRRVVANSRSKPACSAGESARPNSAGDPAERQVSASDAASADSSSMISSARSRMRRGSTSTMRGRPNFGDEAYVGVEPRQEGLEAVEDLPLGDPRELLPGERCGPGEPGGGGPASLGESELPAAEDLDLVEVAHAALVDDIEDGEPFDRVAKAVDAHSVVCCRGGQVDDPAAHRQLAAVLDLVLPPVAGRDEIGDEPDGVDLAAPADDDRRRVADRRASRCSSVRTDATTRSAPGASPRPVESPRCARSIRQIVRRRPPMVSAAGDIRSNGRVSQAGSTATLPGRRAARSSAMRSASKRSVSRRAGPVPS